MVISPQFNNSHGLGNLCVIHSEDAIAPGGATPSREARGMSRFTFQFTAQNVSGTLIVRAEGSLDGDNWWNLSETNSNTEITANGTNAMLWTGLAAYVRFVCLSGGSGTVKPVILMSA
jgi:hypothetical protein